MQGNIDLTSKSNFLNENEIKKFCTDAKANGQHPMFALGGATTKAGFIEAVKTKQSRKAFIDQMVKIAKDSGCDGVDVDWEYPTKDQQAGYIELLKDMKEVSYKYL